MPLPVVLWMGAFQVPPESDRLWIRLLRVSATQRVLPSGETAIPVGWLSSPAGALEPLPAVPKEATKLSVPLELTVNSWMRSLPVSLT